MIAETASAAGRGAAGRVLRFLQMPVRSDRLADPTRIDLRKLREGLGLTLPQGAAVIGASEINLRMYEGRPGGFNHAFTREAVAAYAVHIAAFWAADHLNLTIANLDPEEEN